MRKGNEREKAPAKAGGGKPAFAGAAARPGGAAASSRRYTPTERKALLLAYARGDEGLEAFCARHGLSPTTLYEWRRRYAALGEAGLLDRPPPQRTGTARTAGPAFTDEQRRQAVAAFHVAGMTRKAFAAVWRIDPKTLTEWVKRYGDGGAAPAPVPRGRPKGSGGKTALPLPVSEAVAETKKRFPFFGLRRIRDYLARFLGFAVTPNEVRRTLATQGLSTPSAPRRRRRPPQVRRFERARPGELWQSDITSFVLPRPKLRVYLTVFLDDCSRYVVSFGLKSEQRAELVTEALREGIARYGKPREILTDQGRQYYAWRGKSDFQKLLAKEGIQHVVARSHHPQTVGKAERLWKTVKEEFFERVNVEDIAEARERMNHFFRHYNFSRPHQALDGLCPADRFFNAEDPVRKAIEATLARNELLLAIGEKPRTPVYLAGRIGGKTVSLHGEGGRLLVRTEDGREEAIEMASFGMPGRVDHDAERGAGTSEAGSVAAAGAVRPAEAGGVGAGAVGVGHRGGADEGPRDGGGDPVVVAGSDAKGGGDGTSVGDAAEAVAAFAAGAVGDGVGIAQTAEEKREGRDEPGEPGGQPGGPQKADRHAHDGAAAGAGGGLAPAADAGVAEGDGGEGEGCDDDEARSPRGIHGRPGSGSGDSCASKDAAPGGSRSPEVSE